MSKKIDEKLLICPECKSKNLIFDFGGFKCNECHKEYEIEKDKYIFRRYTESNINDKLDRIKYFFKKYPKFYSFLISLISPVLKRNINHFIKKYTKNKDVVALNIGSGNTDLSGDISNIDIFPYDNVDLVCDIENLSIKDNSVDVIINIAVLEHVPNPEKVVKEMHRVLKKGGIVYSSIPFIQGFHASPYDYSRRTIEGIKHLYKDFETIEVKCAGGPTSGFLWILQEYLAILFSFGIKPLYRILHIFFMLITFPLKFLDFILIKHPMAKNISSSFCFIGKK